jgi:secreted trypsin-like serine protease
MPLDRQVHGPCKMFPCVPGAAALACANLLVVLALVLAWNKSAAAIVGGATNPDPSVAQHVALIVGSHGTSCTGVVIARNLVLTAAHCALPGSVYKIVEFDAARHPTLRDVSLVIVHPQFELNTLLNHRATADVALLKMAAPLPTAFVPAPLAVQSKPVAVGDRFLVVGYGVGVRGDGKSGGTIRSADLIATGQPGTLQIRLVDSATNGARAGLSACTGDSGAPVFESSNGPLAVVGIVSWSTGPALTDGCGGLTGVTPLVRYRDWIVDAAKKAGAALP